MALIVQKYGGTSVGNVDRIQNVAAKIKEQWSQGHRLVVVVSARSGVTNDLIARAKALQKLPDEREMDVLMAVGEQETIALTVMALHAIGVPAVSRTGAQAGIFTDDIHTRARITRISGGDLLARLDEGKVVVVAGFQGVTEQGEVTTLGRGGSDLTAIAVAASIKADLCQIYTDVDGVYTADPRLVPAARKIPEISYDEMLEMAGAGSKVLALRSVEFARNHNVPIQVRSSFTWEPGTWVTSQEPSMEDPIISGVVTDVSEAKVTVRKVPDRPGVSAGLFEPLAQANVNVDMIVQNTSADGFTDISFTVPKADMKVAQSIVDDMATKIGAAGVVNDDSIAKISLVGAGMKTSPGIAAKMFRTLADNDVNIQMISTSTIRISVVVAAADLERAARSLHTAFDLDSGQSYSAPLPERK